MVKTQCMSIILTLNHITCIQYTDIGIKKKICNLAIRI